MSLVDNILSGVILVIILIGVTILITTTTTQDQQKRAETIRTSYLEDKHDASLNAVMRVTDPTTNLPLSAVLAEAAEKGTFNLTVQGSSVDVEKTIEQRFNTVYGSGNYYAELVPIIDEITVSFVLDGSSSLLTQRVTLRDNFTSIVNEVQTEVKDLFKEDAPDVAFQVYIPGNNPNLCNIFGGIAAPGFKGCQTISKTQMYTVRNGVNYTYPDLDLNSSKNSYHFTPSSDTLHSNDWAGGLVYAAADTVTNDTQIAILFPLSGELTTGSIPNQCFESNLAPPGFKNTAAIEVCGLCNATCPETRSEAQLNLTESILKTYQSSNTTIRVNPIYTTQCETQYQTFVNAAPFQSNYTLNYSDTGNPPPASDTWCSFNNCGGCTPSPNPANICFRSSCSQQTEQQMQNFSAKFNGNTVNLTDISSLGSQILSRINQTLKDSVLRIGQEQEAPQVFTYTYDVPLTTTRIRPLTLYVYDDAGNREFDEPVFTALTVNPDPAPPNRTARLNVVTTDQRRVTGITGTVLTTPQIQTTFTSVTQNTWVAPIDLTNISDGTYDVQLVASDEDFNIANQTFQGALNVNSSALDTEPPRLRDITNQTCTYPSNATNCEAWVNQTIGASSQNIIVSVLENSFMHTANITVNGTTRDLYALGPDPWNTSYEYYGATIQQYDQPFNATIQLADVEGNTATYTESAYVNASDTTKLRVLFVPMEYSNQGTFDNHAMSHFDAFIRTFNLTACSTEYEYDTLAVSDSFDDFCALGGTPSGPIAVLDGIKSHADALTQISSYDRIVGLRSSPGCGGSTSVLGYTTLGRDTVYSAQNDEYVTSHEFGHTYWLVEQYCTMSFNDRDSIDTINLSNSPPDAHPFCTPHETTSLAFEAYTYGSGPSAVTIPYANPHDINLGCDPEGPTGCCSNPGMGAHCLGNEGYITGTKSAMGPGLSGPRSMDVNELSWLQRGLPTKASTTLQTFYDWGDQLRCD